MPTTPSQYLQVAEAPQYGLMAVTSAQITRASTLIDAYLQRPEGLMYETDANGNPCYMAAMPVVGCFKLGAAIAPGASVPVTLTGGPSAVLAVGDVLILDRENDELCEAVTIATTPSPGSGVTGFTFQNVQFAHAQAATADYGLVIEEQKYMPDSRPLTTVSRTPLLNVLSGVGRYAYGRRGAGANYNMEQFELLAAVSKFGGPPLWELFQQNYQAGWDVQTGQVWIPAGILLAYYSEVKLRYVAGFPETAIPYAIKMAVAELIQAMANTPPLGNVKQFKAGDTAMMNFTSSRLSADTKQQISRYAALSVS